MKLINITGVLIIVLFFVCCNTKNRSKEQSIKNQSDNSEASINPRKEGKQKNHQIDVKTINTESLGWGYDIYIRGDLFIHQPHIPAINGTRGFETEEKARKAGEFVSFKIQNNISPPSVSRDELDSLGVL